MTIEEENQILEEWFLLPNATFRDLIRMTIMFLKSKRQANRKSFEKKNKPKKERIQ